MDKKEIKARKKAFKKAQRKALGELWTLCKKIDVNNIDKISNKDAENIAKTIAKRVKNVEVGAETSDLANISRTMVTAIGTYFFVNDYRNEVLIESGGKDIEGAKEIRNEKLIHKVSNFIINGTLMNIFNTTFKTWLNKNLLLATLIASATELTNEFLVRKSICQPVLPKKSKQDIIDFENEQLSKKGFFGFWSRTYKKITGKKTINEKLAEKEAKKAKAQKQA